MTDQHQDPRTQQALRHLMARLGRFMGARLTKGTFDDINTVVKDHHRECKLRGVDFPALTAMVLTGVGAIEMFRRDLDNEGIRAAILSVVRKHPRVTREELVLAVKWAFPHYRPGHIDLSQIEVRMPRERVNGHDGQLQ